MDYGGSGEPTKSMPMGVEGLGFRGVGSGEPTEQDADNDEREVEENLRCPSAERVLMIVVLPHAPQPENGHEIVLREFFPRDFEGQGCGGECLWRD